ncbi:chemotaxis protein CheA [Rhodocyclus tenuis]|uniref:histidine kinase n=1 Tax=Rhodocyclus gracilis TaxID=2929842 RepID=A0ABX0WK38_9RHOO|nr:chemotaxis protein CheA [Rhodocyclus gracilis]NJA89964.1 chemotaxis protein CheA [Rhodocyclus gracilis]
MNPLLTQFLSEARDFLQSIAEKLMQLESAPNDSEAMNELFRAVHTLKGNSGLFDFPEMTRVLHAGEDLLDAVREEHLAYSRALADQLLDAMDFVGMLCDEIESQGAIGAQHASVGAELAAALREFMTSDSDTAPDAAPAAPADLARAVASNTPDSIFLAPPAGELLAIPEDIRRAAWQRAHDGASLYWLCYTPDEQCFFQGEDPFFLTQQTPGLLWGRIAAREAWPPLAELDAYRCLLRFDLLLAITRAEIDQHFRYVPEQLTLTPLPALALVLPVGDGKDSAEGEDFASAALHQLETGSLDALRHATTVMLELASPQRWLASALRWLLLLLDTHAARGAVRLLLESIRDGATPDWRQSGTADAAAQATPAPPHGDPDTPAALLPRANEVAWEILAWQGEVLAQASRVAALPGHLHAAATTLRNCLRALGRPDDTRRVDEALNDALATSSAAPLAACLQRFLAEAGATAAAPVAATAAAPASSPVATTASDGEGEPRFGRRADDLLPGSRTLKVDQAKIDRLMNLIGEMVVAKNALPYLAARAESGSSAREMAREIKAQHAVINRIAEEMHDAIMQVRMLPVSFVFQRFPRLVRDISRKLGKEVSLVVEGEDTEADKNVIEALADPLVHIVRNSLDHGLENPQERIAAGKAATGRIALTARQEADRVLIEVRDDGRGIDPARIRRKAVEKGIIDADTAHRISDQEAINLVFAAGFSTAEQVSDLSGRGVGMDVVRDALEKVSGTVTLESEVGVGTCLRLSLPLSMAVNQVMVIESDGQAFGVAMDCVVETVRLPRSSVHTIKDSLAAVLRGRIVPLRPLNTLLGIEAPPLCNEADELAVLIVRHGSDNVGVIVDDFRQTCDVILKPLDGILDALPGYSGSALMGDGSVLLVLNLKELI